MIRARELRKTFGAMAALDRVSFHVDRGEVVGLLGPNGAGKTTCLRILTSFMPPTSGRAFIDEIDVTRDSVAARQRVGYLPEGAPVYPELRVREHLRFCARLRGVPRSEQRGEISRIIDTCGLGEVRGRIVGQLSRGFRQRLGLAAAMLGAPSILILDEPTVGLDPNQMRELRRLIRSMGGDHTILLSSHILSEVEAVCDRVLILHRGKLAAEGPVDGLRAGPGPTAVVVQVRGPVDELAAVLESIDTVERVERLRGGDAPRLRLHGALGGDDRARIAAEIMGAGWDLQELSVHGLGLDEVFASLTEGTAPPAVGAVHAAGVDDK